MLARVRIAKRVIIIFGFSGCGKSTLAKRLAQALGLRVLHPSGIMRDLLEGRAIDLSQTRHNEGYWESEEGVKVFQERLSQAVPVDVLANNILLQEVEEGDVVIDSWSLPWLTDKGIKLYLKVDREVRAQRAALRAGISYQRALDVITMKDRETRTLFQRLYDFDIELDHQVFHHSLDASKLDAEEVFHSVQSMVLKNEC